MKRSIAAKLIRDEPTTIKRCADDIACASVLSPEPRDGLRLPRARGTSELLGLLAKLFEIHHDLLPYEPAVRSVGREEDRLVLPGVPDEVGSALPAEWLRAEEGAGQVRWADLQLPPTGRR